jgi:rhamnose transport system substrate-binding protein
VISYDSAVAQAGRIAHLAPSSDSLIGQTCAQLAAQLAPHASGKIAVLSATPTSTNQNSWLAEMRKALAQYPGLTLAGVAYGDDVADKSYRETVALVKQYPDLSVIVSLSSVGIVAAAKAIEDEGLIGKVPVTGLGLPSELVGYVRKGVVPKFAIWNPIDLGYATMQVAVRLARGEIPASGHPISMERLGAVTFDAAGVGAMGKPFVYDAGTVEQFAKVF